MTLMYKALFTTLEIHINNNITLCFFDITNMYTNIPITEHTDMIKNILYNTQENKKN
jgi:hypothetical protein